MYMYIHICIRMYNTYLVRHGQAGEQTKQKNKQIEASKQIETNARKYVKICPKQHENERQDLSDRPRFMPWRATFAAQRRIHRCC